MQLSRQPDDLHHNQWHAVGEILGEAMAFRKVWNSPRVKGGPKALLREFFHKFALKPLVLSHLGMILNIVIQRYRA